MTTTSPSLSAFSLCIISSYFFIISSVSSIRRLFVPTCTITVSSLPLFSISGTICSILPPGLHTVLIPTHCCSRFLPTCLTSESPTNSTLVFLWLVAAFSSFVSFCMLLVNFVRVCHGLSLADPTPRYFFLLMPANSFQLTQPFQHQLQRLRHSLRDFLAFIQAQLQAVHSPALPACRAGPRRLKWPDSSSKQPLSPYIVMPVLQTAVIHLHC